MEGKWYDPHDILSEMGASHVASPNVATPLSEPFVGSIASNDYNCRGGCPDRSHCSRGSGNEIDMENPHNFDALNRAFLYSSTSEKI